MFSVALGRILLAAVRVVLVAAILTASLGVALGIGLALARMGHLGTCQDGSCELVAVIYVMPIVGIALYLAALIFYSWLATREPRTSVQS